MFNNLIMEKVTQNSIEVDANLSPGIRVEYLMHQYPWFTREQIEEAAEKEEYKLGKILAALDAQSGVWPELYGF